MFETCQTTSLNQHNIQLFIHIFKMQILIFCRKFEAFCFIKAFQLSNRYCVIHLSIA